MPSPSALLLATRNPHKLREFGRLLGPAGYAVEPLPADVELPPELGETFAANALPKARTAARATGRPAIADDSGICAAALGGAPGVRSARYAGPAADDAENLRKFLEEVPAGTPLSYVCVVAYVDPAGGRELTFTGECHGRMASAPQGSGGFGYDPVFVPSEGPGGRTMASLTDAEKDAISHRGAAVRALLAHLRGAVPEGSAR